MSTLGHRHATPEIAVCSRPFSPEACLGLMPSLLYNIGTIDSVGAILYLLPVPTVILGDFFSACVCGDFAQEGYPQTQAGWSSLEVIKQNLTSFISASRTSLPRGNRQLSQDYFFCVTKVLILLC